MDKLVWDIISKSNVLLILISLVVLSVLLFASPFILKKIFSRKNNLCVCGEKINPTDKFCPKCGKKVGK
jgi:hypothetical protein